jgi:hypothetical protein
MSRRRRLLGEVSWLQVAASVLAAVTAAWIASRLGVAGTIVGAALGSLVVTITSAFYSNTLHHGRTLLIQTQTGTMIQRRVEDGEVQEALDEVADVDSPAKSAQFVDTELDGAGPRLHWKTIIVTTVVVLALAIAAISTYELVTGRTLDGSTGTSLTDTFGVSHHKHKDKPKSTPSTTPPTTPKDTTTATTPTPSASTTTPTPSDTTPTPTDTETTR